MPSRLARNLDSNLLFEHFLVAAITTIIGVRLYLHLTGYPQIATGNLHIAHMLWGGLALAFALLGSLLFLNNDAKHWWSILGGFGFGMFIDEVGKFVTQDNNYFYQPTFAIIYAVFVLIYLLYRSLWQYQKFTSQEYLLNCVEELKEVITNELDKDEVAKAQYYLSLSDQRNSITKFLQQAFSTITDAPNKRNNFYYWWKKNLHQTYKWLLKQKIFLSAVVLLFLLRAIMFIVMGAAAIWELANQTPTETVDELLTLTDILPFINVMAILAQATLTILGGFLIWRRRRLAFSFYRYALLISVLVLQVFNFYSHPIAALFGTARDLILLGVLEYMANIEQTSAIKKYTKAKL